MGSKTKLALILIIIIGGALRFYKLGKNPPSLNLDEVAIGYNAFSILKTGRDEYGTRFPLAFRSHDDYKPPLYIYLTVPSVAVFGLNEVAVRFPSALFGIITVALSYFLVKELFFKEENDKKEKIALLTALILAINPWHLQFSRAGFETNVAVFFTTFGIWSFLKGVRTSAKWWIITAINFSLVLYAYQTARLFIPLFSLILLVIFHKKIIKRKKEALLSVTLFTIIALPLIPIMTSTAGVMRFKGTNVFEQPGLIEEEIDRSLLDATNQDAFAMRLYHNRRLAAFFTLAEGYLKHFRPDILFLGRKGPPFNYTPNVGLFYLIELPIMLWGAHLLLKRNGKERIIVISWLLLSPVASAFTWDIPSSTRMTIALPTFQILTALGLHSILQSRSWFLRIHPHFIKATVAIIFLFSFGQYLHQYYIHSPIENAEAWQYGYKEAVEYVDKKKSNYKKVIVSTNLRQPQNFFAFYTKYDPYKYIFEDGGTVSGGFLETQNRFDIYEFHPIDYGKLAGQENIILIDLYSAIPKEFEDKVIKTINSLNGQPVIVISET